MGQEVLGEIKDTQNNESVCDDVVKNVEIKVEEKNRLNAKYNDGKLNQNQKVYSDENYVKNKLIYFVGPDKSPIYYVSELTKQRDFQEFSADTHIISD